MMNASGRFAIAGAARFSRMSGVDAIITYGRPHASTPRVTID